MLQKAWNGKTARNLDFCSLKSHHSHHHIDCSSTCHDLGPDKYTFRLVIRRKLSRVWKEFEECHHFSPRSRSIAARRGWPDTDWFDWTWPFNKYNCFFVPAIPFDTLHRDPFSPNFPLADNFYPYHCTFCGCHSNHNLLTGYSKWLTCIAESKRKIFSSLNR